MQAVASSNVISSLFVGRGKSGDFQIRTTLIMSCIFDKIFGALFLGGYLKCFLQNLKEGLKKILERTYFSVSEHQFRCILLSC